MPSEAQARITINKMLEEAGWRFLPDAQGRRENVVCEHRVTKKTFAPSQDLGKDFEHAPNGFVDFVLLNTDDRLAAVTVNENYIAVSQDAAWLTYPPADRATVMVNKKIRLLRDY